MALGVIACIGTGILIGTVNGTLISRIGINPLIATLAMASLIRGIVLISSEGTIHRAEGDAMARAWARGPGTGAFFARRDGA